MKKYLDVNVYEAVNERIKSLKTLTTFMCHFREERTAGCC